MGEKLLPPPHPSGVGGKGKTREGGHSRVGGDSSEWGWKTAERSRLVNGRKVIKSVSLFLFLFFKSCITNLVMISGDRRSHRGGTKGIL